MPKGTPLWPKCPKCRRGMWGNVRIERGTFRTGRIEGAKISRSKHKGHGEGGSAFYGHRGEMNCRDCGHLWWSTHPSSGAVRCHGGDKCTHREAA